MKKETSSNKNGMMAQYINTLTFTRSELEKRVLEYLDSKDQAKFLYKGEIVAKDQYRKSRSQGYLTSDTKEPFSKVVAECVMNKGLNIDNDKNCTYNLGSRKEKIKNLKFNSTKEMFEYPMKKDGVEGETKLIHCLAKMGKIDSFDYVDYQVPTTNGNADKIDLILKDDKYHYMIEAKTFGSDESLLRCILEIQTYFMKLNERFYKRYNIEESKLKKAVLFDETSFAYSQLKEDWAKKLIEKYDITVLILSKSDKYHINKL